MSKSGCCPNPGEPSENGQVSCSNRFEVMDELNRHYSERIEKIEKTGYTELLVTNLKKWIEALVTHDKVLISTIESLESEALKRSEKITQLCKERFQVEDVCQKYKKELCEKTDIIKELNCRLKDLTDTLNQKECVIKRLTEELDKLRHCLENIKSKSGGSCEEAGISALKCQMESLKRELGNRESKIKSLEEELCTCKRKVNSIQDEPQHVRYNGRVNELELKLERAREEICCLRKKLEAKESELACLKEKTDQSEDINRVDKVLMPDSMLSLKLEEFQRFTDESGKKLQETINDIKQHAGNLLLKEDMEELDTFLNTEQETFSKANRQLYVLLCNIKNTNPALATPANYKLQCLENKLKNALETLDKGPSSDVCQTEQDNSSNQNVIDSIKNKIKESLKIVCDLKQDAPQAADSVDPLSSAGSTKLIQELQEMIKVIQNQSKVQQSRLFAIMDNQKEETGSLTKNFSEVGCLLRSHTKSINYVKDELKIALCNVMQKAEKVRKQADQITKFECTVKDVSNWVNCNLKNNAEMVSKVNQLQKNLQQVMSLKKSLEDPQKEVKNTCDSPDPELNDFEDKCLIAHDLCDEVNKELDKAACRINEREQKLTQLSKEVSSFGELICRIQEDIVRTAHALSDNCEEREDFRSYEEAALNLQDSNKHLLQALHNIKLKLIVHHREADGYDIKGIESRKTVAARLKELEEALHDLSDILGEIKASKYMRTTRALSSESVCEQEEEEESEMSLVEVPSTVEKLCQMRRNMAQASCRGVEMKDIDNTTCTATQNTSPESVIQEMRNEICCLNDTISSLEKQNNCYQSTIETLKCQLAKTKEEADETVQNMDKCTLTRLCSENKKLAQESIELKAMLQCKLDKINLLKREYILLTDEVNQLTTIVQQEKDNSKSRECSLYQQNAELYNQNQWLKKKLQTLCLSVSSAQGMDASSPECGLNDQDDCKRQLQCLQEKYSCLLNQYKDLYNLHGKMQMAINSNRGETPRSGQSCRERRSQTSKENTGCSTEETVESASKYKDALNEICQLKRELNQLNIENERLNNENEQLIKERQHFKQGYDKLMCEKQQSSQRDQRLLEVEQAMCNMQNDNQDIYKIKEENRCLSKNNELMSMEIGELKVELETVSEKYRSSDEKLRCLYDRYESLKKEYDKLHKEKQQTLKDMSEQCEKTSILRDEDCRENMALKQKCDELRQQMKCAQFKIESLEREISIIEKRNLETAMLEADTQLLITKTDQEWNEMYVKKCTEVMELTEELECLRKKISDMNAQWMERDEAENENKRLISMLKKTAQDYKTQIVCLKGKLDKCLACNREMRCEVESLEKSNRSMKQYIVFLNREKTELMEKINRIQSEASYDDESIC